MWNDEDNNPYGSFNGRDSNIPDIANPGSPDSGFYRPVTPPSPASSDKDVAPNLPPHQAGLTDLGYGEAREEEQRVPKRDGYNSRIEQILYENPNLPILITDAGKNHETGGNYITYTIRTGDLEVRRRYSEFASLRQTLVNLHPTLIIPPIPEKHSMADYAAKPTKAKEDQGIIDLRRRMLAVFLNRCRRMDEVREDGVWWRFLDPNASWSEVLHSPPVSHIPKNNLKAPPLDPSNPTPAHQYLPVPSSSAKLRTASFGMGGGDGPPSPPTVSNPSSAAHTTPGIQIFGRFPPSSQNLSEHDLDPYFINFEASSRELEMVLQGSMEKVNRRALSHLSSLYEDLAELGARYNGFSLSEQSPTLAAAIERAGQAADSTFLETRALTASLSETYAEPMRESAQFAGVVRSVLRYRVLKRIQEDLTKEELDKKRALLSSLERSEQEAQRIDQYLNKSGIQSNSPPKRSSSTRSRTGEGQERQQQQQQQPRSAREEDVASIDSDFPPSAQGDTPSAQQGQPEREPSTPSRKYKTGGGSSSNGGGGGGGGGNFVTNKIIGRINYAIHGIVDVDPERTRRDQIGKTKESLVHLEQALDVSERDVKDASAGVLKDLKRFQHEKEDDLRRYLIAFARCHILWAKRNIASWEEAKAEVERIEAR